ncbi:inositol monophosphatase family protein [Jatrophihabitans sp.]|uniref:inositol monophosphatase family protein n=1 Tax=Jatrophihabitans sp. TaxID=1932789 RepID=UPI002C7B69CA|nr:inositol monophosphatase family protein [Jatrophihabitans sp.]
MTGTGTPVPGISADAEPAQGIPGDAEPDPGQLADLAVELAVRAGELMVRHRAAGLSVSTKSSATDVVTDADQAVEQFLRTALAQLRPGDSILGEETGATDPAGSPVRWVLDPIDGTVNYLLGLPQFAVSIAAQVGGQTVAGCVHNPASGDLFRAAAGSGAFLGDRRLTGPRSVPLDQAVVATGFSYDPERRARQGSAAGRLLARIGNLRRLGSAALDLCALAAGWVDMYYEGPLGEWDFAAGLLIATEAGVATSGLRGRPAGVQMVAGAHPEHAGEFFDALTEIGVADIG